MGETEARAQFGAAPGPPGLELPRMKPPDPRISTVPTSRAASVGQGPPPPRPCCPAPSLQSAGLCPPPPRSRHVGLFPQMRKLRTESKDDAGLVAQPRPCQPPDSQAHLVLASVVHPSTLSGFHSSPVSRGPILGSGTPRKPEDTASAQPLWSKEGALGAEGQGCQASREPRPLPRGQGSLKGARH